MRTLIGLYHYTIGLPKLAYPKGQLVLTYTKHAVAAANDEGITLPVTLDTSKARIIEVEASRDSLNKIVYRVSYSARQDLALVVIPQGNIVKTVWLNDKTDQHKTLDRGRYEKP